MQIIATAGIPRFLADTGDSDLIFGTLAAAGISLIMPISLYEEVPAPADSGHSVAFYPPPYGTADAAFYAAMVANGVRLIIPADVLYSGGVGALADDPLAAIIALVPPGLVYGVYNYDEPAHNGIPVASSQAVYERVKEINPSLPILQVHAILPEAEDPAPMLAQALLHSQWADVVGWSIYPEGPINRGAPTPTSGGEWVEPIAALRAYDDWLNENLPGKQHMAVLQGFSLADMYSDALIATFDPALIAATRAPTYDEHLAMTPSGLDMLVWYGPSYVDDPATWQTTLDVSKHWAAWKKPEGRKRGRGRWKRG